ncbi:MAG: LysR family transcriptional regulator [Selenomonadaceae bacterium]|nr:LysR family transcriptional regulator [Selenomonadaceae bacterium]
MYHPFLKTFLAVADSGSFLKASKELFLSPPAIMKQMNALEKYLGLTLMERTNQGIRLTPAGASIYQDAEDIVRAADEAVIRALQKQGKYTIRVGSSLLYPGSVLMGLWDKCAAKHPEFRLRLVPFEDSATASAAYVVGTKCDIVAGAYNATKNRGDCAFLELGSYAFALAMSHSHPLATKKLLRPSDLAGQKLFIMQEGNSPRNDEVRHTLKRDCPDVILADVPIHYEPEHFNRCEEENCLLLTLSGWKNVHPSLVTIPLDVDVRLPYGVIYPNHPSLSVSLFLEILKQSAIDH